VNDFPPDRGDSLPPLEIDDELFATFVAEALDHLGSIEASVLALEEGGDGQAVDEVFRLFHTIKGNAAALGFTQIEGLAHTVEDLLDRARAGAIQIGGEQVEVILTAIDLLTTMVRNLDERRADVPAVDLAARVASLKADVVRHIEAETAGSDGGASSDGAADALANASVAGAGLASDDAGNQGVHSDSGRSKATIKVDTRKLDSLVDLVGELVIVHSMIHEDCGLLGADERLNRSLAQFHRITNELHRGAFAMRLVPIRQTFQRMQRLVRDLGRKSGKPVDLTVSGEDTELDRKVVEEIADPLMHMLRNSIDHGIEAPDVRRRAGKPMRGQLSLSASHEGGSVLIAVSDDGRGLDTDALYARGIANGMLEPGVRPSEADLQALIFRSGFSTASQVTAVSGRGVGMDVVRRNVELLRGRIEIRSRPGIGTTFLIKLPLTLATIEGLLVGVGDQRFVVPTFAVQESLRPTPSRLHAMPGDGWLVDVRNELVPVARLSDLFQIGGATTDPLVAALVVVEDDGRRLALMVDRLLGKQNVVIKSLGEAFTTVDGVAGGAILADGRIGLILDAGGLIRLREHQAPRAA
jgi:two-component system chemotaxis sensor kinase CheA